MWTPDRVAQRLREAFRTLSRLPNRDLRYLFPRWSSWPEIARSKREDFADEWARMPRIPPEPAAIDEMDEVLGWLFWLQDQDRLLLSAWALGTPAYWIAKEFHCSRRSVWRQRARALGDIAVRLNGCQSDSNWKPRR